MAVCSHKHRLGSVMTCVQSATRVVLVRLKNHPWPLWKLPGGSIEEYDLDIIGASIRETKEETTDPMDDASGILLLPGEVELLSVQRRGDRYFRPNLCRAIVSEEKLDTRGKVGDENGEELEIGAFPIEKVLDMQGVHPAHRAYLREALR